MSEETIFERLITPHIRRKSLGEIFSEYCSEVRTKIRQMVSYILRKFSNLFHVFYWYYVRISDTTVLHGPLINQNLLEKTLGEVLFDCCHNFSSKICQINGVTNETETYESVLRRSVDVALKLQRENLTADDVVAFCTSNTIDTIIPILGTAFLGAKISNLEPCLTEFQITSLLRLINAKIIFVEDDSESKIQNVVNSLENKPKIIKYSDVNKFRSQLEDREKFVPVSVPLDETAIILFSSGTSGDSKGICHSHRGALQLKHPIETNLSTERVLHVSRFYWVTAFSTMLYCFLKGSCRVFCPNSPKDIFHTIEKHQVTTAILSSSLVHKLIDFKDITRFNLSSLKHFFVGGNILSSNLMVVLSNYLPCKVRQGYGLTETGTISLFSSTSQMAGYKLSSCGELVPGVTLKVVDLKTEKNLNYDQRGEICVKSSSMFKEFLNLDSTNFFDSENFYRTGDFGYYDEDHCIYVLGRIKEMFKNQEWHIVPSMLENILLLHPDIVDAGVFGVPIGLDGKVAAACIVIQPNSKITKLDVDRLVNDKVTDKEQLRGGVYVVKSLPRTVTGKLIRRQLSEHFGKLLT